MEAPFPVRRVADLDYYRSPKWPSPLPGYPENQRTLFAPYDDDHGALVALVEAASRELVLAMFGFTDPDLFEAVKAKLDDGSVHCQVTLDASQASGPAERELLARYGLLESNSVAVGTSEKGAIMHRKMLIVDRTFLVTGSTNWSLSAEQKQDNQLTVIQDSVLCAEAGAVLALEHEKARTQMLAKAAQK